MPSKRITKATPAYEFTKPVRKNVTVLFHEIFEPGSYYSHSTGWLYRVLDDGLTPGHSPMVNIYCHDECYMTKISDDPWIPVGKAREICANWDFEVNFQVCGGKGFRVSYKPNGNVGLFLLSSSVTSTCYYGFRVSPVTTALPQFFNPPIAGLHTN